MAVRVRVRSATKHDVVWQNINFDAVGIGGLGVDGER
jgi:hypothetical protein